MRGLIIRTARPLPVFPTQHSDRLRTSRQSRVFGSQENPSLWRRGLGSFVNFRLCGKISICPVPQSNDEDLPALVEACFLARDRSAARNEHPLPRYREPKDPQIFSLNVR